jgi:hypothetical protein
VVAVVGVAGEAARRVEHLRMSSLTPLFPFSYFFVRAF